MCSTNWGLVEQWGSGIPRMLGACRESGLSPPEWDEIGVRLRVALRTDRIGEVDIDPTDRAILGPAENFGSLGRSARVTPCFNEAAA